MVATNNSERMPVVTRFAPSPTGLLHIGGARTALFNWLFARRHDGRFVLRIEDTDQARSTDEAIAAIIEGLQWLGLDWDGEPVFQSARAARHTEVASLLLAAGHAYHCYSSAAELDAMRAAARAAGGHFQADAWRERDPAEAPAGIPPVTRFKAPRGGDTVVQDGVLGEIRVAASQLDDMVLLRADGTPTYNLAVVVDDHDLEVSHILRGADHLNNAVRQTNLYRALNWEVPKFSHLPLIHGPDGAKLSKRHGAMGVAAYRDLGYVPEALRNYLLRLGWSHGDEEIISTARAIELFDIGGIGKSAARFDFDKLSALNGHYLRAMTDDDLCPLVRDGLADKLDRPLDPAEDGRLREAVSELKQRAKTIVELIDSALFYFVRGSPAPDEKAARLLDGEARSLLGSLGEALEATEDWSAEALEAAVRDFAEGQGLKLVRLAQPLRAALTGRTASPGIFQILATLGREESLARVHETSQAAR